MSMIMDIQERKGTIHICKFDSDKASRVQMQLGWDGEDVLVLSNKKLRGSDNNSSEHNRYPTLKLTALLKTFEGRYGHYIFHEQSTLPYLFIILLLRMLFFRHIRVIYDMHDLNEEAPAFTYCYMRYLVCYLLEFLVTRLNVQIMTVSQGLQKELMKRYNCQKPVYVVYNIPVSAPQTTQITSGKKDKLLYFGQIEPARITDELLTKIAKSGYKLFLHGTITFQPNKMKIILDKHIDLGTVVMMGAYRADDLSFLDDYTYSIIDYSATKTKNVQFCLPNKLFQSLRHGLVCLISSNLQEARELFKNYPGNVVILKKDEQLDDIIRKTCADSGKASYNEINAYLDSLLLQSKKNYLQAVYF